MKKIILSLLMVCSIFANDIQNKLDKAFIEIEKGNDEFVYYSILKLAKNGNPEAQYLLARVYASDNFKKNQKESISLLKKSAKQGYIKSINALGVAYYNGIGVEKDYKMALKYFKEAVKEEDFRAYNNIGVLYEKGQGVIQNYQQAYRYYLLAYTNGDKKIAPYNIAMLSITHKYIKRDNKRIVELLKMADENGNPNATYRLGLAYKYGYLGVEKNCNLAFNYFFKAYKSGHDMATSYVGESYYIGEGTLQNIKLGMSLIIAMSKKNDAYAQYLLGMSYYEKHDLHNSAYYLRLAWRNGCNKAKKMLADPALWNKTKFYIFTFK
jgi:TPR repeat protein